MSAKFSTKQNFPIFDVFGAFARIYKKIDWLSYGIHPSQQKKQVGLWFVLEMFPSGMG